MKYGMPIILSLLLLAGCRTPTPRAAPAAPPSQKERSAKKYLETLERQLATRESVQSQFSNQVNQLHADLLSAAGEMRTIKQRANELSVSGESNRLAMAAIEAEIMEQRNVVLACEKEAAEEAAKVAALQDALNQEQNVRTRELAEAEVAKKRALAEEAKKTDAVKVALSREQQLRERDQAILREHEKQMEELRRALEERDKLLRARPGSTAQPVAVPPAATVKATTVESPVAPTEPPTAIKLVAEGNARLRENKLEEAEKAFKSALALDPDLLGARVGLAACRYTRADLPDAKREIVSVLEEDPRNAQALGLRGLIYWREGDLVRAADVLQKAVKQDATDSQLQNYLGIVLFESKKRSTALEALSRAVELDPANGEAQFNLAVVQASGSNPDLASARQHYETALALGSERDEALDEILNVKK